ncbi:MAG: VWA domain-containing protein [Lachnospiraceae bacterium]|nr:VWA domain-containing protein [Lachnospiraceae bacterium]
MMKRRKITALVSLMLCLILGISGLSVGIVKAVEDTEEGIELITTDQVILESDGSETVTNEEEALQYFMDHAENYGIADAENSLVMQDASEAAGYGHYSFKQVYQDIPVYGNCLNIMTNAEDGTVLMSTGVYRDIDENIDLTTKATKEDIIASIEENFIQKGGYKTVTDVSITDSAVSAENLVIYSSEKEDVLAYELDASFKADEAYMDYHMIADAKSGVILDGWSNWNYVNQVYSGANGASINVSLDESTRQYQMYDEQRNIRIIDLEKESLEVEVKSKDKLRVFLNEEIYKEYKNKVVSSDNKDDLPKNAVDFMYRLSEIYDWYRSTLGIIGYANHSNCVLEAFYNDGYDEGKNGGFCSNGFKGIIMVGYQKEVEDVAGHEYGHLVFNHASSLSVGEQGESQAISEAFADVMNEITSNNCDWENSARNMRDPEKSIDGKLPSKYSQYDSEKDGHYNSTILSHAAYHMTEVKDDDGKIIHNGMTEFATARLWYNATKNIPKSDIGLQEFGWLMYKTAIAMSKDGLLSSEDVLYVEKALKDVGIEFERITTIVNYNFDCFIKDYYNAALDDVKVEFYEMTFSQEKNDKDKDKNDGKWHVEKKPAFTIESTDKNAQFKAEELEKECFYQVKITDNKYQNEKPFFLNIHCVSSNKQAKSLTIMTEFRKDVVTDFALPDEEIDLAVDELKYMDPLIKPKGLAYDEAIKNSIAWNSSNNKVVTVDKNGQLKGIAEGTATVTATLKNKGHTFTDETTVTVTKKQRDTILVLDCSGSMTGKPMQEMKQAAVKFCEAMLNTGGDNRIEIISYDNRTQKSGFMDHLSSLESYINNMRGGGGTDTYDAMKLAVSELTASARKSSVQNIVIMSDGAPNGGNSQSSGVMTDWIGSNTYSIRESGYGNAVCAYYDNAMKTDYDVYSLGFFHSLYDTEKAYCSYLMNYIQNSGFYEVEDADNLQISFSSISGQVNNGSKIVITVACPVDITVSLNGETLSSSRLRYNDNTSFGTLKRTGIANDIKVLELDSANDYELSFEGNGAGTMDYTITYYGSDDSIEESRNFSSVPVSASAKMTSNTAKTEKTELQIDSDGDGQIDSIWTASANSDGKETFKDNNAITAEATAEAVDSKEEDEKEQSTDSKTVWVVLIVCSSVIILTSIIGIVVVAVKKVPEDEKKEKGNGQKRKHDSAPVYAAGILLDGSMKGKQLSFENGKVYTVGKDAAKSDILLDQQFQSVSRVHCTIEFDVRHNGYYITDYSSNGTYLMKSQRRLQQGERMLIARNTIIYFARKDCRMELR